MVEDGKKVVVFGPLDNNNRSNNITIARNNWGPAVAPHLVGCRDPWERRFIDAS